MATYRCTPHGTHVTYMTPYLTALPLDHVSFTYNFWQWFKPILTRIVSDSVSYGLLLKEDEPLPKIPVKSVGFGSGSPFPESGSNQVTHWNLKQNRAAITRNDICVYIHLAMQKNMEWAHHQYKKHLTLGDHVNLFQDKYSNACWSMTPFGSNDSVHATCRLLHHCKSINQSYSSHAFYTPILAYRSAGGGHFQYILTHHVGGVGERPWGPRPSSGKRWSCQRSISAGTGQKHNLVRACNYYLAPGEKENHLQNAFKKGYVSSPEGRYVSCLWTIPESIRRKC